MQFADRTSAGQALAEKLRAYANRSDVIVLGLPRGGVPVASEVAKALKAPLDIFLVRKLGVPGQEELAMGAIASGDVRVLNDGVVSSLHLSDAQINQVVAKEQQELERRERLYREDHPVPTLRDQTIILVDDGLATGATMRAAIKALRQQQPARIVVAVPVSSPDTYREMQAEVDEVICPLTPETFHSVGFWYKDFSQTTDEEVTTLLQQTTAYPQPLATTAQTS